MKNFEQLPFVIIDLNSGRYVQEHSVGHEKFNLKPNPIDGLYYGYCPPRGRIRIERLGAKMTEARIDNVIVVYTQKMKNSSNREVIAFTDNATVFREEQSGKGKSRQILVDGQTIDCGYHIISDNLYDLRDLSSRFEIRCGDYNSYMFRRQRVFKGRYPTLDKLLIAWLKEYLLLMNQDDSLYQEQLEDSIRVAGADSFSMRKPEYLSSSTGRVVKKNPSVSKRAVAASNFTCAYDSEHHTFQRRNNCQYMEGHHLIPCTSTNAEIYWTRCSRNIDCVENIVALCPTCHRRIHFGSAKEKSEIVEKLFNVQVNKLKSAGLDISLKELRGLYGLPEEGK